VFGWFKSSSKKPEAPKKPPGKMIEERVADFFSEVKQSLAPDPVMGGSFTPRAVQVLAFAREEAQAMNHDRAGTEHVLLGLMRLGSGVAVHVLEQKGLTLEMVREDVKNRCGVGAASQAAATIPFTPRVKKSLAIAARIAKQLDHTYVGTEHLLMALLSDPEGGAAQTFARFKIEAGPTRELILQEINPNFIAPAGEPANFFTETDKQIASANKANRFTPRAVQALALARKEAIALKHNFVGTEHVLLGLIRLQSGIAYDVLKQKCGDIDKICAAVQKHVGFGPAELPPDAFIPYTPRVKKVLALAMKEAKALNHTFVGTEHILLGLLRENDGVAARILKQFEVKIEPTRQLILEKMGHSPPPPSPDAKNE
jgi:ATP-dependent Clp protease ATP-binding subunit ClpA